MVSVDVISIFDLKASICDDVKLRKDRYKGLGSQLCN